MNLQVNTKKVSYDTFLICYNIFINEIGEKMGKIVNEYLVDRENISGKFLHIANSDNFNFGYILFIPNTINCNTTLMVEGSNVSCSESTLEDANAHILRDALYPNSVSYKVAYDEGLPVLYPLFPRVNNIYNHMLSSDSINKNNNELDQYGLKRVDIQLLNMINDAKETLKNIDILVDDKIIISGFSASGKFANRFTVLHPEVVKLCIAGGISGVTTLPLSTFNDEILVWPNGVGNLGNLIDSNYDNNKFEEFKQVKQFYYMGSNDILNDPFKMDDAGSPMHSGIIRQDELMQMNKIFGTDNITRWNQSEKYYSDLGINAKFNLYQGYAHDPVCAIEDIKNEIKEVTKQIIK